LGFLIVEKLAGKAKHCYNNNRFFARSQNLNNAAKEVLLEEGQLMRRSLN